MRALHLSAPALLALAAACPSNDPHLDPPARGFQLSTPGFDVPSGSELQACHFFRAPDLEGGQPYFIQRIEVAQAPGSHHMNIFRVNTVHDLGPPNTDGTGAVAGLDGQGPCFKSSNWADWPLLVNSQQSAAGETFVLQLPDGVGHKLAPGEALMLQTHYVNATTQRTPGRGHVLVNFEQSPAGSTPAEVGTLFSTKQSISICPDNPRPSFTGFCRINSPDAPVTIVGANAHFHSRGTEFTVRTWDGATTDPAAGELFYRSDSWADPPMITGLDIAVPAGHGISYTCSYEYAPPPGGCSKLKDPNCCYTFGPLVETSEHCNVFVYYYPKAGSTDITCF